MTERVSKLKVAAGLCQMLSFAVIPFRLFTAGAVLLAGSLLLVSLHMTIQRIARDAGITTID